LAATCNQITKKDAFKLLYDRWAALSDENAQIWHRKSEADALRYEREVVAWGKGGFASLTALRTSEKRESCCSDRGAVTSDTNAAVDKNVANQAENIPIISPLQTVTSYPSDVLIGESVSTIFACRMFAEHIVTCGPCAVL